MQVFRYKTQGAKHFLRSLQGVQRFLANRSVKNVLFAKDIEDETVLLIVIPGNLDLNHVEEIRSFLRRD